MTQPAIENLLSTIPLFAGLPREEIHSLAVTLKSVTFPEKSLLLEEGHIDNRFYILVEGWVEIIKAMGTPSERVVGLRQYGTLLGEMSMFTRDGAHTASVVAKTPVRLLTMSTQDFKFLLERNPSLAFELVGTMSQRLVESENMTIIDLEEKNRNLLKAYEDLQKAQAQVIEKEKLEHELEISRRIQRSILPQTFPISDYVDYGAMMQPARAVGGDFFDFIHLPDGKMGIVIGDVSDKGVPAALYMAVCFSLMRVESQHNDDPEQVLRQVNRVLLEINIESMYVTMVYGILDEANGFFRLARAGHPRPVILNASCEQVNIPLKLGQPLGILRKPQFDLVDFTIPQNGMALLYSDGLSEAIDDMGEFFGSNRINRQLEQCKAKSSQQICSYLWENVQEFTGDHPQQDDFTVLVIRRKYLLSGSRWFIQTI